MRKWKVIFKDGEARIVMADRRYEAIIKAAMSIGLGGHSSGFILSLVKSAEVVNRGKAGRPKSLAAWKEKDWEKEMGLE